MMNGGGSSEEAIQPSMKAYVSCRRERDQYKTFASLTSLAISSIEEKRPILYIRLDADGNTLWNGRFTATF
jgi:hypothetical protein